MKKILSAVAALGLVAGVASTASALEFNVSGHYFLEGVYLSSGDGSGLVLNDDTIGNDAFWRHEFKIKPTMKVNDKITVKSTIYLAENAWGTDDTDTDDGNNINVHQIYMEYMSPVGKVRMGRTSAGLWQGDFLSSDSHANRLMYFPNMLPENWGACLFLQKSAENDGEDTDVDADHDLYEASAWYKTKDMVVALGYDYFRNAAAATQLSTKHRVKGYYNQNFSKMYAEVEFQYETGEVDNDVAPDTDRETLGLMADVGMNMDKLDVGMMFIYGSGDDDGTDNDVENLGALGEQFQPYNILTGATTGMMSQDFNGTNGSMTTAGIVSLGVHANFAVSDKLSLNSALAYAQAESERATALDDEYGWEIDLGMSYALLDNLTYQMDFGYLMTGDFFETATADAEDVYVLTHRLTMEF
jgi:hypothetical protein